MAPLRYLALSGGSLRGIAHIGAVEELVKTGHLDLAELRGVAGASAGSVVGLFLATRQSLPEMWRRVAELDTGQLIQPDPTLLLTTLGLVSGDRLQRYFEDLIAEVTGNRHANFRELYLKTGVEYIVVGTCLEQKRAVYYSHRTTPYFKVAVAVRISTSIPGFFSPVRYRGQTYLDGSMMDDYPLHLYDHCLSEAVGIMICNSYNTEYQHLEELPRALLNLAMYKYYSHDYHAYPERSIYVDDIDEGNGSLDFRISEDVIQFYRDKGRQAVRRWQEREGPERTVVLRS